MATGGHDPAVELMEETLQCLVCHVCKDTLKDPRTLPECGHTFCFECIQTVYVGHSEGVNSALCPLCKTRFYPKGRSAGTLPKNFIAKDMLEIFERISENMRENDTDDKENAKCDVCNNGEYVVYCAKCSKSMCQACQDNHRVFHPRHETIRLNDIKGTAMYDLVQSHTVDDYCATHPDKKLTLYCDHCNMLICDDCNRAEEHRKHRSKSVGSKVQTVEQQLKKFIEENQKYLDDLETCHAYWRNIDSKLSVSLQLQRDKVTERAKELRDVINKKERNTISAIEKQHSARYRESQNHLTDLEARVNAQKEMLTEARAYIKVGSACQKLKGLNALMEKLNQNPMSIIEWPPIFFKHTVVFCPYRYLKLTDRELLGQVTTKFDYFLLSNYWSFQKKTASDIETLV